MKNTITIAIDGWSSCGKSTLAKDLAKKLNYIYVDSGAMYRGVALYALKRKMVSPNYIDEKDLIESLSNIHLQFEQNEEGKVELYLNGVNVEKEIRLLEVSNVVSSVAKIKKVRQFLVEQQRKMGEKGGIVMDGRDIGSVVFPDAELKLFITADPAIRAERRYQELLNKGEDITLKEVEKNIEIRDEMDANRKESPLIQTKDAIVIDNSHLTLTEQLEKSLQFAMDIIEGKG